MYAKAKFRGENIGYYFWYNCRDSKQYGDAEEEQY